MKGFLIYLWRKLPVLGVSLLMSITIWIIAVTSNDPIESGRFTNPISIETIGLSKNLILTSSLPEQVYVTMKAPSSTWKKIAYNRILGKAIVDLTNLSAGEYDIPLQIQIGISPIQITSYSPEKIHVSLEEQRTADFEVGVRENGEIPTAFKAETPLVSPSSVKVSGSASAMDQVKSVRVVLDHSNMTETIERELSVAAIDANGAVIKGLVISPEKVTVRQKITLRGGYRVVAAKIVTAGQLPAGYRVKKIGVDPGFLTIYCQDKTILDSIPGYLETETVDISAMKENVTKKVSLKLPEGANLVGDQAVTVKVEVEPIEGTVTLSNIRVYVFGLEDGYKASISPDAVDVLISGPLSSLDSIKPEDVFVALELQNLKEGNYPLTPRAEVRADGNFKIQSLMPGTIEVEINKN